LKQAARTVCSFDFEELDQRYKEDDCVVSEEVGEGLVLVGMLYACGTTLMW